MKKTTALSVRSLLLAMPAVLASALSIAQVPPASAAQLTDPPMRISDEAIQNDHRTYEEVQARLKALNEGGRRLDDYHLAKAQCWLDVSFHEYTRNDRSAFPQGALDESVKLVEDMEKNLSPLPMQTRLVNEAAKLRPDLWAALDVLKAGAGLRCAPRQVACAEVELAHAGNESNQQGWRHAQPYVQIAEDLTAQARVLATGCR